MILGAKNTERVGLEEATSRASRQELASTDEKIALGWKTCRVISGNLLLYNRVEFVCG